MRISTRRQFLGSTVAAGAGLAAAARSASAIEPISRTGPSHLRLSIAAYSYRKYLDLKARPKPSMTLLDLADLAAQMNLDAIEPTAYYFAETTPAYLAQLKGRCTRLGLDVSGTAVGNNFCVPDPQKLRKEIDQVKRWVEHSSRLGAKTIRIFAGTVSKGDTEEAARRRTIEAIQEACDYAGQFGIFLALENHGGIVATANQMLSIVQAVQHPWFGVNLDTANFHTPDPYADLARLAPYAVTVQIKSEIHPLGQPREDADLYRLIMILRATGYRGYVALEYEADEEPKTAIPRHIESLKRLMG